MRKKLLSREALSVFKHKQQSKIRPPPPVYSPVIRVSNNIVHLGLPKEGPKPRQLLSLPPFPGHPLPGRNSTSAAYVTAISWLRYYFNEIPPLVIQKHFNEGLVQSTRGLSRCYEGQVMSTKKIRPNDIMEVGARVHVPVSVAESKVSKRFDVIPSATLNPNADEIEYIRRLVMYKDSAILVLNKPPNLPVKGPVTIHNSMDALAAASLSYNYDEGPKLVCRLDRESSGLLLMGRTKESISYLQWLFSDTKKTMSFSKEWNDACDTTYQRYWALVIGSPKQKEGLICAPLTKVLLNDGKTARVMLAHNSGLEASQEAITEYRVLGPIINGCSWIELRPRTNCKHQLRVHCAEALGTPIVGDYKYGWFVHSRWKQLPRVDYEATTGEPYKMRRPEGLDVHKGSVLSKVPRLHLHCREMVLPNIAKFIELHNWQSRKSGVDPEERDILRFIAPMPSHMKISWNLMSSYLV
ncbi:RNA pseudouridine synthase 3, mitochondrial [Salvia miltiorrhiza]|uniref:RNA pseudouridine synthase 3, mitochondrial n=1 Tax=Salvia miltiorrhiza TaxID=226208 RepID=UPI0025AD194D|nr:RNA pseudouridine synthase 3, mitochondrial [Salvia miltiorrhiza]XP_057806927.1 RNA pseudouridine synthase 3, mitochondrial [Salvia miltiorrhiza]XP_057806928.1 RNA pseudouridine synthase 3, mitochondrial [Salvia miltiorrhiza]XP_057806929.1 RNA pseudouridine synthase 3, mitochondrial [Salvia miltiorrhiza]XP_057806931.1 RNA pseudouridine synthase 3, mitochondrial [Salvia miltiorrhiza]